MKFIATTSAKVKDIAIVSGQVIFSKDDRIIYLDSNERTEFRSIITVPTEEFRLNITYPVEGFYFVNETTILYQFSSSGWKQITTPPQESLVFLSREEFPVTGKEKTLYVDDTNIYQWNKETNEYVIMGGSADLVWGTF